MYRGTDEKNCAVAVKVIDCRGRDTGIGANQLSEVRLSEGLDHPGVVKTLKWTLGESGVETPLE